ncbi:carbohydrate ABC transporter permease [Subtercola sp. RTI3]|uniref:carbohydrate ABC transporter permease n=1 Tax=Subtercola sp. RTI3 TaxID=3048639 RepID=UPI002B23D32C|nr:carbohydrate ABC transporter permease [Subtercola sp. RTI3]MEA9987119.1 carbohydrate ABC transporter permease [Subtercola sp. RTI3]
MSTTELHSLATTPPPAIQRKRPAHLPQQGRQASRRPRNKLTIIVGIVLGIGALATAFPFIWMVTSSLKPRSESVAYPPRILPQEPTLDFFVQLFQDLDFGRYLLNTIGLVLISMIGLLLMAMAGYGFAKFTFRGRDGLFFLVLVTMMIPVQVTMIPTYLILNGMKLTNTLVGIALPTLVSGFSVFLFRQFMSTLPSEMLEAARIDGAGEFRIFLQIVLPLSKPILAVQVILTFIASWNSFLWPLIIANDERLYTLSVGIALLNQQIATNPSLQMAAATLMVVPILVIFVVFQRYVVQGFALSGLK